MVVWHQKMGEERIPVTFNLSNSFRLPSKAPIIEINCLSACIWTHTLVSLSPACTVQRALLKSQILLVVLPLLPCFCLHLHAFHGTSNEEQTPQYEKLTVPTRALSMIPASVLTIPALFSLCSSSLSRPSAPFLVTRASHLNVSLSESSSFPLLPKF